MMKRPKLELKTAPITEPAIIEPKELANSQQTKRPSRANTRVISGHFPEATLKRLKRIGVDESKSIQALLEEAIEDLFGKYSTHT